MRLAGDRQMAASLANAVELGLVAARARATADHATAQLAALDQAVRGISGVLDVERVLQLIVDRVRDLVQAQYAALGIVDARGAIERFITSGIGDEERRRIGELPRGRGLLGLIIRENRTYRIPDIGVHPERHGFPPHHPAMTSFLGMPITTSRDTVGRLYLTNKLGAAEFSPDDQALVEKFALHAGIAIENARLHDQVRRLAVVDERDRISRDLHDSVIQSIYAQTLALDDVPDLMDEDPDDARRRVDEAIEALNGVIRDIRNFIFGLRPVLLEAGTLTDGLRHLATELHRNGGVDVEIAIDDAGETLAALPIEVVAELLAITREALSNIARHAAATHATVRLEASPTELELEVSDDGRGFDAGRAADRGHHGLANIRARSEALGGTFSVTSARGGGSTIIIGVPRSETSTETQRP
jgi:signal transduction histidine kinase